MKKHELSFIAKLFYYFSVIVSLGTTYLIKVIIEKAITDAREDGK